VVELPVLSVEIPVVPLVAPLWSEVPVVLEVAPVWSVVPVVPVVAPVVPVWSAPLPIVLVELAPL
jgi:hypothetical protein